MRLPFTPDQFFAVFAAYNTAVWPVQLLLVGLAVAVVAAAIRPRSWTPRFIGAALAILWIWMGLVYHLGFFRAINPAAGFFAALFVLEGVLLGLVGTSAALQLGVREDLGLVVTGVLTIVLRFVPATSRRAGAAPAHQLLDLHGHEHHGR